MCCFANPHIVVNCVLAPALAFDISSIMQDCMVVVGGRLGIPGDEPIPVTCDLMSKTVEILWWKPPPEQQQPTGKVQMLNSVMELYNNTHLSDVTLIVEERQIPAHRHVLATHSQMFDRMWNHTMKEVSWSSFSVML